MSTSESQCPIESSFLQGSTIFYTVVGFLCLFSDIIDKEKSLSDSEKISHLVSSMNGSEIQELTQHVARCHADGVKALQIATVNNAESINITSVNFWLKGSMTNQADQSIISKLIK